MFDMFKKRMVHQDFVFESTSGNRYDIEECARRMITGKVAMRTSVDVTRRVFVEKDSVSSISGFLFRLFVQN